MTTDKEGRAPLYVRALRLRNLHVGGFGSFVLFECMIAIGVLLALAELVTWWAVLVLPVAVAVMVKINDVAMSGSRARRAAGARERTGLDGVRAEQSRAAYRSLDDADRATPGRAAYRSLDDAESVAPGRAAHRSLDDAEQSHAAAHRSHDDADRDTGPAVVQRHTAVLDRDGLDQAGESRHAASRHAAERARAAGRAERVGVGAGQRVDSEFAVAGQRTAEQSDQAGQRTPAVAGQASASRTIPAAGSVVGGQRSNSGAGTPQSEETRRPVGVIRISLPPRDGGTRGSGARTTTADAQPLVAARQTEPPVVARQIESPAAARQIEPPAAARQIESPVAARQTEPPVAARQTQPPAAARHTEDTAAAARSEAEALAGRDGEIPAGARHTVETAAGAPGRVAADPMTGNVYGEDTGVVPGTGIWLNRPGTRRADDSYTSQHGDGDASVHSGQGAVHGRGGYGPGGGTTYGGLPDDQGSSVHRGQGAVYGRGGYGHDTSGGDSPYGGDSTYGGTPRNGGSYSTTYGSGVYGGATSTPRYATGDDSDAGYGYAGDSATAYESGTGHGYQTDLTDPYGSDADEPQGPGGGTDYGYSGRNGYGQHAGQGDHPGGPGGYGGGHGLDDSLWSGGGSQSRGQERRSWVGGPAGYDPDPRIDSFNTGYARAADDDQHGDEGRHSRGRHADEDYASGRHTDRGWRTEDDLTRSRTTTNQGRFA